MAAEASGSWLVARVPDLSTKRRAHGLVSRKHVDDDDARELSSVPLLVTARVRRRRRRATSRQHALRLVWNELLNDWQLTGSSPLAPRLVRQAGTGWLRAHAPRGSRAVWKLILFCSVKSCHASASASASAMRQARTLALALYLYRERGADSRTSLPLTIPGAGRSAAVPSRRERRRRPLSTYSNAVHENSSDKKQTLKTRRRASGRRAYRLRRV